MSRIRIVEQTGSTNADLLADQTVMEGDWLVALTQDAGRGRQGREWVSESGNFFGSTLVSLRPNDPSPASLSLSAALALIVEQHHSKNTKMPSVVFIGLSRSRDGEVASIGTNSGAACQTLQNCVTSCR